MGSCIDLATHILPIKGKTSIHYLCVYIVHSEKRKERKEADLKKKYVRNTSFQHQMRSGCKGGEK